MSGQPAFEPWRQLVCERCGHSFGCNNDGSGRCWCGQESFRLPQPLPPGVGPFGDCLCPTCLRAIAAELARLYPERARARN